MPFQKGHKKMGGRRKGVPTARAKLNNDTKDWIGQLLNGQKEEFEKNFAQLKPKEYCSIFADLLGYIVPKQKAIALEAQLEMEYQQMRVLLKDAPAEAVELITKKMQLLNTQRNDNNIK